MSRLGLSGQTPVPLHGRADERLEAVIVKFVALAQIDGAPGVALQAGVEQARRIRELRTLGEGQLDDALIGLAGADDPRMRPHRHPRHFHSSTTSGSASLISARTCASVLPRRSSCSPILASISREALSPSGVLLLLIATEAPSAGCRYRAEHSFLDTRCPCFHQQRRPLRILPGRPAADRPIQPRPRPRPACPRSARAPSWRGPGPPSRSLPEDRYRPVNAALDSAPGSWHVARLLILLPRGRDGARTRTHHPVARTCEPEPRAIARRFCTNDFGPRTREPGPAAAKRISARTNSILARPNPSAGPQRPECTNEQPATRSNPGHPNRTCRTVRRSSGNARPNPSRPLPVPLPATPDHSAEPAPRRRRACFLRARPNPSDRPHATSHPAVIPPPACRRSPTRGTPLPVRPRSARASVLARPLFHHPPVCLKTVTTPSTPSIESAFLGRVATTAEGSMRIGWVRFAPDLGHRAIAIHGPEATIRALGLNRRKKLPGRCRFPETAFVVPMPGR